MSQVRACVRAGTLESLVAASQTEFVCTNDMCFEKFCSYSDFAQHDCPKMFDCPRCKKYLHINELVSHMQSHRMVVADVAATTDSPSVTVEFGEADLHKMARGLTQVGNIELILHHGAGKMHMIRLSRCVGGIVNCTQQSFGNARNISTLQIRVGAQWKRNGSVSQLDETVVWPFLLTRQCDLSLLMPPLRMLFDYPSLFTSDVPLARQDDLDYLYLSLQLVAAF